ncbi:MAG: hypothetical protein ACRD1P_01695 [Thermoanaerobaculia bacterium]
MSKDDKDQEHRAAFVKGDDGKLECANCGSPEDGAEAYRQIKELRDDVKLLSERIADVDKRVSATEEIKKEVGEIKAAMDEGFTAVIDRLTPIEKVFDAAEEPTPKEYEIKDE